MAGGCRSAWQECALVVSLEMFNLLLERCNAMLKEQLQTANVMAATPMLANSRLLGEDLQIILPAIKVINTIAREICVNKRVFNSYVFFHIGVV